MLLNCGVGEVSWESLGLQGDPTSPSLKEISPEYSYSQRPGPVLIRSHRQKHRTHAWGTSILSFQARSARCMYITHRLSGKQWKQCQTLFSGAPKSLQMVTAAMKLKDAYSLEEKLDNLDSILKSRDITLLTKVHLVKAMIFPIVMYGCESWTIKKAESWRTDAFELWCWRWPLRAPWTARAQNSES